MLARVLRISSACGLLLLVALGLPACYQRTERLPQVDEAARRLAEAPPGPTLCVVPVRLPRESMLRYGPVADRLTEALGRRVLLRPAASWHVALQRLESGEADLAVLGSTAFARARRALGAEGLARVEEDGRTTYRGVVAVRADDPARSLEDLRGRRLALVSPESTTGQLLVLAAFRRVGLRPEDLGEVTYEERHELVARAVLLDRVDAGAMREETFRRHEPGLRALWRSEPVPGPVLAARAGLPEDVRDAVRRALVESAPEDSGSDGAPRFRPFRLEDEETIEALLVEVYGDAAFVGDLSMRRASSR